VYDWLLCCVIRMLQTKMLTLLYVGVLVFRINVFVDSSCGTKRFARKDIAGKCFTCPNNYEKCWEGPNIFWGSYSGVESSGNLLNNDEGKLTLIKIWGAGGSVDWRVTSLNSASSTVVVTDDSTGTTYARTDRFGTYFPDSTQQTCWNKRYKTNYRGGLGGYSECLSNRKLQGMKVSLGKKETYSTYRSSKQDGQDSNGIPNYDLGATVLKGTVFSLVTIPEHLPYVQNEWVDTTSTEGSVFLVAGGGGTAGWHADMFGDHVDLAHATKTCYVATGNWNGGNGGGQTGGTCEFTLGNMGNYQSDCTGRDPHAPIPESCDYDPGVFAGMPGSAADTTCSDNAYKRCACSVNPTQYGPNSIPESHWRRTGGQGCNPGRDTSSTSSTVQGDFQRCMGGGSGYVNPQICNLKAITLKAAPGDTTPPRHDDIMDTWRNNVGLGGTKGNPDGAGRGYYQQYYKCSQSALTEYDETNHILICVCSNGTIYVPSPTTLDIYSGSCQACSSGKYALRGDSTCKSCPIGSYCPNTVSAPRVCSSGNDCSSADLTTQSPCPAGYYCPTPSQKVGCVDGDYCVVTGLTARSLCPAGSHCPHYSQKYQCEQGNYCPEGSDRQSACGTGDYCPTGSSQKTQCPAGSYCSTTTTITTCSAGVICPAGSTASQSCSSGQYCPMGATAKVACQAGFYCSTPSSQQSCPLGSYCVEGVTTHQGCSSGDYCAAGSSQRTSCPATNYCPNPSTKTSCSSAGVICPAGVTAAQACSSGDYCPVGATAAVSCDAGFYCATAASRQTCPAGSFCASRTVTPSVCPAGSYCPQGSSAGVPCTGSGNFCAQGSSSEGQCPAGSFCSSTSSKSVCPAGSYCPAGSTAAVPCTGTGNYCAQGSTSEGPCPAGSFCSSTSSISTCTVGNYCPQGSTASNACDAGKYCPNTQEQRTCPSGNYCPRGTVNLVPCLAGSYCPNATVQFICPAGFSCAEGTVTPSPCGLGYLCNGTGFVVPSQCPSSYYCPDANTVTRCPAGSFCPAMSSSPRPCLLGSYCAVMGLSAAVPCAASFFCPNVSSQQICPAGFYCPVSTSSPVPCTVGMYCVSAGLSDAVWCPSSYYCPTVSTKFNCTSSNYCPIGSSAQRMCDQYFFCPNTSTRVACAFGDICPAGSVSPQQCPGDIPLFDSSLFDCQTLFPVHEPVCFARQYQYTIDPSLMTNVLVQPSHCKYFMCDNSCIYRNPAASEVFLSTRFVHTYSGGADCAWTCKIDYVPRGFYFDEVDNILRKCPPDSYCSG